MKLLNTQQTCYACPAQWESQTEDNRPVYIRYRWGRLSVQVGEPNETIDDMFDNCDGKAIFVQQIGDNYDGSIELDTVMKHIQDISLDQAFDRIQLLLDAIQPSLEVTQSCSNEHNDHKNCTANSWDFFIAFNDQKWNAMLGDDHYFKAFYTSLKTAFDQLQPKRERTKALNHIATYASHWFGNGKILSWAVLKNDLWLVKTLIEKYQADPIPYFAMALKMALIHQLDDIATYLLDINDCWQHLEESIQNKYLTALLNKVSTPRAEKIKAYWVACELNGEKITKFDPSYFSAF